MAQLSELSPDALVDALGVAAAVLADHADALDRLALTSEEADQGGGPEFTSDLDPGNGQGQALDQPTPGTDLAATLESACSQQARGRDLRSVSTALHAGAVRGAQGDAGRGLSMVLGSLADVTSNADVVDGERLALALELAAERLLAESDAPEIGTMSAVLTAAASGALSALDQRMDLGDILIAASDDGLAELEAGPVSNPGLAARGAVDSAAAGLLLVLDALAAVVTGEPPPTAPTEQLSQAEAIGVAGTGSQQFVVRCVVEPLEGCGMEAAAWLESTWHEIGRLIGFQVKADRWHVELHTTLPGAAVEALCSVGIPSELHIGVVDGGSSVDGGSPSSDSQASSSASGSSSDGSVGDESPTTESD
ncbi:MAG: hypothetical protein WBA45_13335 [Microthrixaceae bacterium]